MNLTPKTPKSGLDRWAVGVALPAIKAKISGGMVAGLFFVATGFGPDEWFKRLFAALHLPEYLAAGLKAIDPRVALVGIGVVLIGIDILLRHYRHQPALAPVEAGSSVELVASSPSATSVETSSTSVDQTKPLPLPDKPSIAVLPFQNLSGDAEQEYFCDGVVDDITTALSRAKWLFVIARNSAFAFKGKNVDARQIGRDLGVRYLLQGSVRRAANNLRINGQLIEAETGKSVWADNFDGEYRDIFELQARVASHVAASIEPKLYTVEIDRTLRKPTDSLSAYDYYLRALPHMTRFNSASYQEEHQIAERLLRKAIEIDSRYSLALAWLADCIGRQCIFGSRDWDAGISEALDYAVRAVESDADNGIALACAAWLNGNFLGRYDAALRYGERAVLSQPNSIYVNTLVGDTFSTCGELKQARSLLNEALRINPLDPRNFFIFLGLAKVSFFEKQFDDAIAWANRVSEVAHFNRIAPRFKASALYHLGRLDEARETISFLYTLLPVPSLSEIARRTKYCPEMKKLYLDGLKGAGYGD